MFSIFKKRQPLAEASPLVVPRIKQTNFAAAVDGISGMTASSRPIIEPLVGDLLLTYAIDIGPTYMSVSPSALQDHDLQQSELRSLAQANALSAMRNLKVRTDGKVHEITADDNMAACSVLFPALWQQIEQEAGGPVVAAFPHRDFALYARLGDITALKSVIETIDFDETHALSKLLYQLVNGEWQVVTP